MSILRERETWARPRPPRGPRGLDLTPEQREHVRAAVVFLRTRHGSTRGLARAMGVSMAVLYAAVERDGKPGAALAVALARAAKVPVDDILGGLFPTAGACPYCGR